MFKLVHTKIWTLTLGSQNFCRVPSNAIAFLAMKLGLDKFPEFWEITCIINNLYFNYLRSYSKLNKGDFGRPPMKISDPVDLAFNIASSFVSNSSWDGISEFPLSSNIPVLKSISIFRP